MNIITIAPAANENGLDVNMLKIFEYVLIPKSKNGSKITPAIAKSIGEFNLLTLPSITISSKLLIIL